MKDRSTILIFGGSSLLGQALQKVLLEEKIADADQIYAPSSSEIDLVVLHGFNETEQYIRRVEPDYIFMFAAYVGGIQENIEDENKAEFLYANTMMQNNVILSAYRQGVKNLLFAGSSCMYPKDCPQPMKEAYIGTGQFEPTNQYYALAKFHGAKLIEALSRKKSYKVRELNYITAIFPNLFGPLYNEKQRIDKHIVGQSITKLLKAQLNDEKHIEMLGFPNTCRELMYAEDAARLSIDIISQTLLYDYINVGTSYDLTISEILKIIEELLEFRVDKTYSGKMVGMPRKLMDSSLARILIPYNATKLTHIFDAMNETLKSYQNSTKVQELIKKGVK